MIRDKDQRIFHFYMLNYRDIRHLSHTLDDSLVVGQCSLLSKNMPPHYLWRDIPNELRKVKERMGSRLVFRW